MKLHNVWKHAKEQLTDPNAQPNYSVIKAKVLNTKPSYGPYLHSMYKFVINYCGGHDAPKLHETVAYERANGKRINLKPELHEALCKQYSESFVQFRHALRKYAVTGHTLRPSDASKLLSSASEPTKLSDQCMHEVRSAIARLSDDPKVYNVALEFVHEMDIDLVKFAMDQKLGKTYKDPRSIACDAIRNINLALGKLSLRIAPVKNKYVSWLVAAEQPTAETTTTKTREAAVECVQVFDSTGAIVNTVEVMAFHGFKVGGTIKNKHDGTIAEILDIPSRSSTITIQIQGIGKATTAIKGFIGKVKEWTQHKSKSSELVEFKKPFKGNVQWNVMVVKSAVTVAIDELAKQHDESKCKVDVFKTPLRVVATSDIANLVLVPVTYSIKSVESEKSSDAADDNKIQFTKAFDKQCLGVTSNHNFYVASPNDSVVSTLYFKVVQAITHVEAEANIEIYLVQASNGVKIPCIRNRSPIASGSELKLFKPKKDKVKKVADITPAPADDGEEEPKKKRTKKATK